MASHKSIVHTNAAADHYFVKYTIEALQKNYNDLITDCERRLRVGEMISSAGDKADSTNLHEINVSGEKLKILTRNSKLLTYAAGEIKLFRHILGYKEILETMIDKTKMRYERLNEENNWLLKELKYFKEQSDKVSKHNDVVRKKMAHMAFIFNQRRSWNDHCLPIELSGLPQEVSSDQGQCVQIEKTLAGMRPKFPELNHIQGHLIDFLKADFDDGTVINCGSVEVNNTVELSSSTPDSSSPVTVTAQDNSQQEINQLLDGNASNSTKLSLTELKNLMLGDNAKDLRKAVDTTLSQRKAKVISVREKASKYLKELRTEWQLSDIEKETMKKCMKTLKTEANTRQASKGENELSLEDLIELFVRSDDRSDNLGSFIRLINQFSKKETRNPGIGLCWLAILSLKKYEKELRKGKPSTNKRTPVRLRAMKQNVHPTPEKVGPSNVTHQRVVEDLCRLLNLISHHYKERNELKKAAECLKFLLKIRRITRTWKQVSVAVALYSLSIIHAAVKDCNSAIVCARKALQLRRDLLACDSTVADQTVSHVAVSKHATHLALLIMSKQQSEQKKLRYHRFPFKDVTDVAVLLNESIGTLTSLTHVYANSLSLISNGWDAGIADRSPSTLGDSADTSNTCRLQQLSPVEECLMVSRNALSVYYICMKKWNKAQRVLHGNLQHIDSVVSDEELRQISKPHRSAARAIKLTCLKCLLHVYRHLDQDRKGDGLLERIVCLDRYYRKGDEIGEEDMIRMCQNSLYGPA
ncbi:Kinesin light chain [Paragonimus heterotremus]|uniref:Kinesin light chain n=1 Tax=Paragonimus heterotremus TaxID=100268 RepID=A0A8J4WKE9_9TREM|nr:Kinesin light chain [Paragonimus heterotremus]